MPNFGETYTDDEVAGVIDYLHNAFVALGPKPSSGFKSVKPAEIKALRNKRSGILDVNKRARDRMKILA